jgi:uncharacterized protein YehS (DUF1456 family)
MGIKKHTIESINERKRTVDKELNLFFKTHHLDLCLSGILYFYGKLACGIRAGTMTENQYRKALNAIIECLENNNNRTRSGNGIQLHSLGVILKKYEDLYNYDTTFDYHNVSEIIEYDGLFLNYIPLEMVEVDAKRVVSDWLENLNSKLFFFPTEECLEIMSKELSNTYSIKNDLGHDYEEIIKIEKQIYQFLFSNAVADYQKSCGRQLSQKEIQEDTWIILGFPLIFFKNRFLKKMKDLEIKEQYFKGLLLSISSVSNLENTIIQYPFKGAFIELDSFRFITSCWWFTVQSGNGIRYSINRQVAENTLNKMYEDATRTYMKDAGFSSFKISKPIEIDGIGIYKKYLFLVENLHSRIPDEDRNSFPRSRNSSIKGRIGKRFLNKFFQIDKRYNWVNSDGFEYLKQNPHSKTKCCDSDIAIPIILSPDKEMLPDKIGRYIIANNRIFGYMVSNISLLSEMRKIGDLDVLYLPWNLYGLLSSSFLLPRVGKNSIMLPDIFCDDDSLQVVAVHRFLYEWQLSIATLDSSFSIQEMLKELDYTKSKDIILLASICTLLRDIYVLNKLLASNTNTDSARGLLYILENITTELMSIMDLMSINDSDDFTKDYKKTMATMILNFSNCKMSSILDCMMIDFLGEKVGYPINTLIPFINNKFNTKKFNLNQVLSRDAILQYSLLIFQEASQYLKDNKAENESVCLRHFALIFGMDFPIE